MISDSIQSCAESVLREAERLLRGRLRLVIAVDGRCGSGKTTLAAYLRELYECNVFHMDDFFLTPEQRTAERLAEVGGNVDYERFLREVLVPLREGRTVVYRPYNCQTQRMEREMVMEPLAVSVVEGAYSCHPDLVDSYDLKVFVDIDAAEQLRRIRERSGEAGAKMFAEKWIPLEERYFATYRIKELCDIVL